MAVRAIPEPTKGVIVVPKPPRGAKPTGEMTARGDPVWEHEIVMVARDERGVPVKDAVLDPKGEPRWRKHPTTGEALYPIEKVRRERRKRRFVLHIERNERGVATGMITKNYNFEPDPAERDRLERAAAKRDFQDRFAEAAVARGLSVDQLLDQVLGAAPEPAVKAAESDEAPETYPKMRGVGKWALSAEHEARWEAGEIQLFQGTKAAAQDAAAKLGD